MMFSLFIVLSDIQLTWTTVKIGNPWKWSSYLLFLLYTSLYPSSDCWPSLSLWRTKPSSSSPEAVLWLLPNCGDVLATWLWSTQNREHAQRLYWAQQECVPIGSALRGFQAWSCALSFAVRESLPGDGPPLEGEHNQERVLEATSEPG